MSCVRLSKTRPVLAENQRKLRRQRLKLDHRSFDFAIQTKWSAQYSAASFVDKGLCWDRTKDIQANDYHRPTNIGTRQEEYLGVCYSNPRKILQEWTTDLWVEMAQTMRPWLLTYWHTCIGNGLSFPVSQSKFVCCSKHRANLIYWMLIFIVI